MTADPSTPGRPTAGLSRGLRRLAVLLLALALGALIWAQLPSGAYSTDLSRIGAGQPVVVLTRNINHLSGAEVMELLNVVREESGDHIHFLMAHQHYPDAQRLAARHGAVDGTVLLFAGDGRRLGVLHQPRTVEELRVALTQAFGVSR